PSCQNPESSAAGLAIPRPREGCGPGFLTSQDPDSLVSRIFFFSFFSLLARTLSPQRRASPSRGREKAVVPAFSPLRSRTHWCLGSFFFFFFFLLARTLSPQRRASPSRGREKAVVPAFSPLRTRTHWCLGSFFFLFFPSCQNPESSAAGLAIPRPREGCGPGFLASQDPDSLVSRIFFFFSFFFPSC
ncbi:hypothetical protein LEMLEM_LOCUS18517, partial [Lemmus lemmus]